MQLASLFSGSSGNGIYIGTKYTRLLIDAGLSGKKTEEALQKTGIAPDKLDAILVTHEHVDHVRGVGVLARRYSLPVYATCGTWDAMGPITGDIPDHLRHYIYAGENFTINEINISPFSIPHDANEPVGFRFESGRAAAAVATDLGHITPELVRTLTELDALVLESNYDLDMLASGSYPEPLKRRIHGRFGHLSNAMAGELLIRVMCGRLKNVFLGHLSEENNRPELAFQTVAKTLEKKGIIHGKHITLETLMRHEPGRLLEIEE
ncbi:MAG: MBL fold metallo-hydrolase [Firmicutes bacterium]|nr:MBL fold metallo-hydrolase [Bacillota bacterium]